MTPSYHPSVGNRFGVHRNATPPFGWSTIWWIQDQTGTNERRACRVGLWLWCTKPNIRKQLHVVWLRKESWTGQLEYMSANGRSSNIKKVWSVLKVVNATHLCENPLLPLFQTIASVGTNCTRYSWYAHRYPVNLHANWLPWHMELLDSAWTAVRFLPVTQAVFNDPQNSQLLRWVTVACGPPPWHLLRWRLQVSDSWWHLRSKLENPLWQKAPVTLNFQE